MDSNKELVINDICEPVISEKKLRIITVICAVLCALIFSGVIKSVLFTEIFALILCGGYAFCAIYGKNIVLSLLPAAVSLISSVISAFRNSADAVFAVRICLAALTFSVLGLVFLTAFQNGLSKTVTMGITAFSYLVMTAITELTSFFIKYGSISLSLISEKTDLFFDNLAESLKEVYSIQMSNYSATDYYKEILGELGMDKGRTINDFAEFIDEYAEVLVTSIKVILPAVIIICAVLASMVLLQSFSLLYRGVCGKAVSVSGKIWNYTVSGVTMKIYNIALLLLLLGMIINIPSAILVACINLIMIIAVLLNTVTIKTVYGFMRKRNMHPVGSAFLILIIYCIMFAMMSILGFFFAGLAGTYLIQLEQRNKNKSVKL